MRKVKKKMTAQVITKDDMEHTLAVIKQQMLHGSIDEEACSAVCRGCVVRGF